MPDPSWSETLWDVMMFELVTSMCRLHVNTHGFSIGGWCQAAPSESGSGLSGPFFLYPAMWDNLSRTHLLNPIHMWYFVKPFIFCWGPVHDLQTTFGDSFNDDNRHQSDMAYQLHVFALCSSSAEIIHKLKDPVAVVELEFALMCRCVHRRHPTGIIMPSTL